jgi:CubicO group peptidase (beta-lactamase class C family)
MSTGVDYSEEYRDLHSGAAMIGAAIVSGKPAFKDFVASMKPADTKPGTQFNYQSVNTQVLVPVVKAAKEYLASSSP